METVKAFIFGLTLAIAIGPIAVLIINRGLTEGFKSGLLSGLGAALADFTYGLVAFTIGSFMVGYLHLNHHYFELATSGILLVFGVWMLKGSLQAPAEREKSTATAKGGSLRYLFSTYLLTVLNPLTVVAFVGFSGQLLSPVSGYVDVLLLALAIFSGSFLVQAALALLGASLGRFIQNPAVVRMLNLGSSLCIMLFGLAGLL